MKLDQRIGCFSKGAVAVVDEVDLVTVGKVHLLYLTAESFPTFRSDVAVLFGKYLPQEGVSCDVVAPLAMSASEVPVWSAGKAYIRRITGGAIRFRILSGLHGFVTVFRADPTRYQAVQVRDMPFIASIVLPVAKWKRLPLYYWMSYPIPEAQIELARDRGLRFGLVKFLYPWISGRAGRFLLKHLVFRLADHIFVQSPQMRNELVAFGVESARMTPVLMGVDLLALRDEAQLITPHERLGGQRVIGYLGTLIPPRQIERLFEMLAIVRRKISNAVLLLVGDTEDVDHRQWLHEQASLAGVAEAVIWTGWVPTQTAWSLMRNAEVAVSPFPRGPLLDSASPTKVPEYLALGIPVVCNDNPDQAAVIRDSGAGICVPYSAGDFAAAVVELLSLHPSVRDAMVAAGRRYVEANRDYRGIASEVAEVYRRLVQCQAHG